MSKQKKQKSKAAPPPAEEQATDPLDVLRQPAHPPRPNLLALLVALGLFFAWFVYLIYVAVTGSSRG